MQIAHLLLIRHTTNLATVEACHHQTPIMLIKVVLLRGDRVFLRRVEGASQLHSMALKSAINCSEQWCPNESGVISRSLCLALCLGQHHPLKESPSRRSLNRIKTFRSPPSFRTEAAPG